LLVAPCFVRDMTNDPIDAAMVQAIAQVSQKLGLNTVAEFVEDEATLNLLAEYGVNFAQGYHIHKPEPLIFK
jgi:EAL domain-containing protein (putative c-di-GMP-specific phosphodiesterase class I)